MLVLASRVGAAKVWLLGSSGCAKRPCTAPSGASQGDGRKDRLRAISESFGDKDAAVQAGIHDRLGCNLRCCCCVCCCCCCITNRDELQVLDNVDEFMWTCGISLVSSFRCMSGAGIAAAEQPNSHEGLRLTRGLLVEDGGGEPVGDMGEAACLKGHATTVAAVTSGSVLRCGDATTVASGGSE